MMNMGPAQKVFVNLIFVVCLVGGTLESKSTSKSFKPLGEHVAPKGVTLIGVFSSPGVFFQEFVKNSKPILMKGVLQTAEFPPLQKWNTKYLRNRVGEEIVSVEPGKKEDRSREKVKMTVNKFLDKYKEEDLYLVSPLPEKLKEDIYLPASLSCGGLERSLMGVGLWLSSGGTASVLHRDQLDNLLCVVSGTKDIILIDKAYKNLVETHGFESEGTYSKVDVDAVDPDKFPRLTMVPWHKMHLGPGDCGYIPYKWYHQVRSHGKKSLAVNFWFSHLWWLDQDACIKQGLPPMHSPLPPFASPNEALRCSFLEPFSNLHEIFEEDISEVYTHCEPKVLEEFFEYADKNGDDELSWSELYSFDIDGAVLKFPTLFAPPPSQPAAKASRISKPPPPPPEQPEAEQNRSSIVIKVPLGESVVLSEELAQKTGSSSDGEKEEQLPDSVQKQEDDSEREDAGERRSGGSEDFSHRPQRPNKKSNDDESDADSENVSPRDEL